MLLKYIWTWPLPLSMPAPSVSVFPRPCRLLCFAPPWPLRTLSRSAWLSSAAAPISRQCRRPPRPGPWPYHLTLLQNLHSSYRQLCCCRPTGHWSLSIPLGPLLPPCVSAGSLTCTPRPLAAPPGPISTSAPPHDFPFPFHLPCPSLRLACRMSQLEHFPSGLLLCCRPAGKHLRMLSILVYNSIIV
jgi:hypothetical protein